MPDNHIITWGDDGYEIHGPFASGAEQEAYASWWQFVVNADNPNWHAAELDAAHAAPDVWAPPMGAVWTKIVADYRASEWFRYRPAERSDGGPRHNYLITFPKDAAGDHVGYQLVGPFDTDEGLSAYGHYWEVQNPDNISWFSLYLADPKAAPRVTKPEADDWPFIWEAHEALREKERRQRAAQSIV
jgi:hypothetical protein